MADFITLSCPTCGGKLNILDEVDRFACGYCGQEHVVNRGGGIVFLKPIVQSLQLVQSGVDRTAAELSIARIEKEIHVLDAEIATREWSRPKKQTIEAWKADYIRWAIKNGSAEEKARKDFARIRREYERNKTKFEQEWQSAYENELKNWEQEIMPLKSKRNKLFEQLEKNRNIVDS